MKWLNNKKKQKIYAFLKKEWMLVVLLGIGIFLGLSNSSTPLFPSVLMQKPDSQNVGPLAKKDKGHEVFGFAPYWNLGKLNNVDFNVLTTLAYFDIPVDANGTLSNDDGGYSSFESQAATDLFTKAHLQGTRVVLTITQMDNATIIAFLSDPAAQQTTIDQTVNLVKQRGIDGVNVDFEYSGDPGAAYRGQFTQFMTNLSNKMHKEIPGSKVSVSVYATAAKTPQLDDIGSLSGVTDYIFMMAYDFATTSSSVAMPTDPLYGYKAGKYWYDISTAVADFTAVMPANKLILGLPWYGYNYPVSTPADNSATTSGYYNSAMTQTYSDISTDPTEKTGWDPYGKVGWKAYYLPNIGEWRMVYVEDAASLGIKYDFAKEKNLAGVGIWALGFDDGSQDMWNILEQKFGPKIADAQVTGKPIN